MAASARWPAGSALARAPAKLDAMMAAATIRIVANGRMMNRSLAKTTPENVTSAADATDATRVCGSRWLPIPGLSELVLDLEVDLAPLDRAREDHPAAAGKAEQARVAFGDADLVGDVGAPQGQHPVLADVGDGADGEVVIAAQRLLLQPVTIAIAHAFIGEPELHAAPAGRHHIGRGQSVLELRLAAQAHAADGVAPFAAVLRDVGHAAVVAGIVAFHVEADQRHREMLERRDRHLRIDALGHRAIDEVD